MKVTIHELVQSACQSTHVDPEILMSIIYCESEGDKWAHRYEPEFYEKYLAHATRETLSGYVPDDLPNLETEKRDRAYSYGLCQILGETARSRLHVAHDNLTELLDPELNVMLGATMLASLNEQYSWIAGEEERLVAVVRRYNGRGPRAQAYQQKVYRVRDSLLWQTIAGMAV